MKSTNKSRPSTAKESYFSFFLLILLSKKKPKLIKEQKEAKENKDSIPTASQPIPKEEDKKLEQPIDSNGNQQKNDLNKSTEKRNGTPVKPRSSVSSLTSTPQKKEPEKVQQAENLPGSTKNSSANAKKQLWNDSKNNEEDSASKKINSTKSKAGPVPKHPRSKPAKKEIGKIGGMRGKLGIVMTEEDANKEESKDSDGHVFTEEGPSLEESNVSGQNSSSIVDSHRASIGESQQNNKEPVIDELSKLYSKLEKTKNPAACAKIANELESMLAKFKQLSNSSPKEDSQAEQALSENTQSIPDVNIQNENQPSPIENPPESGTQDQPPVPCESIPTPSDIVPIPFEPTAVHTVPKTSAKKNPAAQTDFKTRKVSKMSGSLIKSPNKKFGLPHSEKTNKVITRLSQPSFISSKEEPPQKRRKKPNKRGNESLSEELKLKVIELYGDDAQFDDIQTQLVTAMREDKRSKSASPNKSAKEVVLKLHNKLMQKQKESEADILKRLIERQKRAQEQRKLKSLERQQVARKNNERIALVKERQAELEAEKQKLLAETGQKYQLADVRYEKRMNDIKTKARAEGEKVEEVLFMKDAGTAGKRALIDSKITETIERKKAILDQTKQKQDILGHRIEMAEKKRLAMHEEQKAKLRESQQKRDDAEARRKEKIDQKKVAAEEATQKAALANERKKQLYDEVMNLYTYLCKKENLWECLESGIQWYDYDEVDLSKLTPFDRIKRKLMQDYTNLVFFCSFQ